METLRYRIMRNLISLGDRISIVWKMVVICAWISETLQASEGQRTLQRKAAKCTSLSPNWRSNCRPLISQSFIRYMSNLFIIVVSAKSLSVFASDAFYPTTRFTLKLNPWWGFREERFVIRTSNCIESRIVRISVGTLLTVFMSTHLSNNWRFFIFSCSGFINSNLLTRAQLIHWMRLILTIVVWKLDWYVQINWSFTSVVKKYPESTSASFFQQLFDG